MDATYPRWNAADLFDELDGLATPRAATRESHRLRMVRLSATTSIPVSRQDDIDRSVDAARRMGRMCRLPEEHLDGLVDLVSGLTKDLVQVRGGILRLTPVPGASHLAILVEAEGASGRKRHVVDGESSPWGGVENAT